MEYERGNLFSFFARDHDRIERIFNQATSGKEQVDRWFYERFRAELLHHIKMEETILIPAVQAVRGDRMLEFFQKIRLDHGAIVALLVPEPIPLVVDALKAILAMHNKLEEQEGGMYEVCEHFTGHEVDRLLKQLQDAPDVPTHPLQEPSAVLDATRRALARAGYNLDDFRPGPCSDPADSAQM